MATMSTTALALRIGALAVLLFCTIPVIDAGESADRCGEHKLKCPRAPAHSVRTCKKGKCGYKCTEPWGDCDYSKRNGCETNLDTSVCNCNRCGKKCRAPSSATVATCEDGKCGFKCKGAGASLCNGTCTDTQTDPHNCGGCGTVCPTPANVVFPAGPRCVLGACTEPTRCVDGFFDCDSVLSNGCESDIVHDETFCSSCATACPAWFNTLAIEHRVANCVFNQTTGICGIDKNFRNGCHCGPGPNECFVSYGDCDNSILNGCECLFSWL